MVLLTILDSRIPVNCKRKVIMVSGWRIKPAILNQDMVENHFSQLRGANGQNESPTYQLTQGTQNSIIYGQSVVSRKSNTGGIKSTMFVGLPNESLFCKNKKIKLGNTSGLLVKENDQDVKHQ